MSNNKQALDLTDITVPLPVATHGLTMEDRDASSSTPMIDRITDVNQTPYYVDKSGDETIGFLLDCAKEEKIVATLVIEDFTELIRNFIAYEQPFPQGRYYFTSYAHAMDMLIDTQEDIAKLVESKVLVNRLGSNQEAADMINKICKNISITDFYYTQEFKKMDKYYNSYWPNNIALLKRIYFNDPWIIMKLIAFYFTMIQTSVAVLELTKKFDRADGSKQ